MRARKRVLLYCADAELGSTIAWVLGVRCSYPYVVVVSTFTAKDFLEASIAEAAEFDCVVVVRSELGRPSDGYADRNDDRQVLALLRGESIGRLTVEILNGLPALAESCAEKLVYGPVKSSMLEIVEMVRLACARKRGPNGYGLESGYQLRSIGHSAAVSA
jgi:hypothetical protein